MRGITSRVLLLGTALVMASATLPSAVMAQDDCSPDPPYGTAACVVEFEWDQPVLVEYGVATKIMPFSHRVPGAWNFLRDDTALAQGGCGDSAEPLLITRRIPEIESVDLAEQVLLGEGTRSTCPAGHEWAGLQQSYEVPGEPWTYTILVSGLGPCEGAYTDTWTEAGNGVISRAQPESTTVTATVTCYHAGEEAPSGDAAQVSAQVGVLNSVSWDVSRMSQFPEGMYRRPPPVVLGTITLPSVGSGSEAQAVVAQLAPVPVATSTATEDEATSRESKPRTSRQGRQNLERIARLLFELVAAADPMSTEEERQQALKRANGAAILYLLLTGEELEPEPDVDESKPAQTDVAGDAPVDGDADPAPTEDAEAPNQAAKQPTEPPPSMSGKAIGQDRTWVWLPDEAPVRKKGATHWLKPGVWYQQRIVEDDVQVFYDKNGKLVGRSRQWVSVQEHWTESLDFDPNVHYNPSTETEAAIELLRLLFEATTGSEVMKPEGLPPEVPNELKAVYPERRYMPVYAPLPAQAHTEDAEGDGLERLVVPGRWYIASPWTVGPISGWFITNDQGADLGIVYGEDTLKVFEPGPG